MLPDKGIYIAGIVQSGLKTPEGKCPSFDLYFECRQKLDGGEWVAAGNERITESFNLVKRDGNINEINVRMIKESLGWDGASFAALNDTDWTQSEVQIRVDEEAGADGKTYRCVKYLNHRDYAGPSVVGKADAQSVTSLDQKYGAMLRALTGAAKTASPAKPKPAPGKPAPAMKPAAAPAGPLTAEIAKGQCWKAFTDKVLAHTKDFPDDQWDDARKLRIFQELIGETYAGKTSKTLTVEEWKNFQAIVEKDFSAAAGAIIPF